MQYANKTLFVSQLQFYMFVPSEAASRVQQMPPVSMAELGPSTYELAEPRTGYTGRIADLARSLLPVF